MSNQELSDKDRQDRQAFRVLITAIVCGLVGIAIYAPCPESDSKWYYNLAIGMLVAGASMAFGGFFGFLFGMPRTSARSPAPNNPPPANNPLPAASGNQQANQTTHHTGTEPSTNLEQISDWLTKILVGAGLTQLNKIPGKLGSLCDYIARGMSDSDADRAFALAVIIFFNICGFLAVFLWARLYMADLLEPWQLRALREKAQEQQIQIEKAHELTKQMEQSLREKDQEQQVQLEKAKDMVKQIVQSGAVRAMEDPLLSERQAAGGEAQVAIAAQLVNETAEPGRSATDLMILAFHEFQAQNYKMAAEQAEKALRASPQKELLWKIYNLLGLCYHCQQPAGWKPGDNSDWFDQAKSSYESAIANKNSLSEELLSKGNLCFVYLDAQKYPECEALAESVIQHESVGGLQVASLCDLARIAAAAAKVLRGDKQGAVKLLNETKNISAFAYLFNEDDLPPQALQQWRALPGLTDEVRALLKQTEVS